MRSGFTSPRQARTSSTARRSSTRPSLAKRRLEARRARRADRRAARRCRRRRGARRGRPAPPRRCGRAASSPRPSMARTSAEAPGMRRRLGEVGDALARAEEHGDLEHAQRGEPAVIEGQAARRRRCRGSAGARRRRRRRPPASRRGRGARARSTRAPSCGAVATASAKARALPAASPASRQASARRRSTSTRAGRRRRVASARRPRVWIDERAIPARGGELHQALERPPVLVVQRQDGLERGLRLGGVAELGLVEIGEQEVRVHAALDVLRRGDGEDAEERVARLGPDPLREERAAPSGAARPRRRRVSASTWRMALTPMPGLTPSGGVARGRCPGRGRLALAEDGAGDLGAGEDDLIAPRGRLERVRRGDRRGAARRRRACASGPAPPGTESGSVRSASS